MSTMNSYINSYCVIRNNAVRNSEGVLLNKPGLPLDDFLTAVYEWLNAGYPKFYKMDRLSKLGFLAAEVILKGRTLREEYTAESVALVLSNAHSSLDTDIRYWETMKTLASPALFVYTLPNIVTGEICIRHGLKGENAFFVSERFDPGMVFSYTDMVLSQPGTQACISGWVDVMDGRHDVFLYLAEKEKRDASIVHSARILADLYE
jgi:hypothetical protein